MFRRQYQKAYQGKYKILDFYNIKISSRIDHISACSIVVFNKEYQFQPRQGIITAYDPGHLAEHVLK